MKMIGIIFAGISNQKKHDLVNDRPASMLPIAGNYRAIDFSLSNMINSGVGKVAVLSQYNARSTSQYLNSPSFWGFGRKQGGLELRSPSLSEKSSEWYRGKVDSMADNIDYLENRHEPYVVLAMGDGICRIDYDFVLERHIKKNAEITVVVVKKPTDIPMKERNEVTIGEGKKITSVVKNPGQDISPYITAGIYIIRRRLLISILKEAKEKKLTSFVSEILIPYVQRGRVYAFVHEGYWRNLSTKEAYIRCNKDFLKEDLEKEFFREDNGVIKTRGNDNPPAKFLGHAAVSNSIIGEGAIIDGTVTDSVIFEGVEIGKGAKVIDSLVLPGAKIGPGREVVGEVVPDDAEI